STEISGDRLAPEMKLTSTKTRSRVSKRFSRDRDRMAVRIQPNFKTDSLIRIGADHLVALSATQCIVGIRVDRVLEEANRSVDEEEVRTAGVLALEPLGGVVEPASDDIGAVRIQFLIAAEAEGGVVGHGIAVEAERDGRARGATDAMPELVADDLNRDRLADEDRVAGTVGGAVDRRQDLPPVTEHAPHRAES